MAKNDCTYCGKRTCKILMERICDVGDCNFFKSNKQHQADINKYPPIDYKHFKETGEIILCKRRD